MTRGALVLLVGVLPAVACDDNNAVLTFPSRTTPSVAAPAPPTPAPGPPPNTQEPGPRPTPTTRIAAGEVVSAAIEADDPACFPNWDSAGRCRQYEFTAAVGGELVATLTLPTPARGVFSADLFLVAPDQSWLWAGDSLPQRSASARIATGETYRVVVLGYGPFPDRYELTADVYRSAATASGRVLTGPPEAGHLADLAAQDREGHEAGGRTAPKGCSGP